MNDKKLTAHEYRRLVDDLEECQHLIEILLGPKSTRDLQILAIDTDERSTRSLGRLLNHLQQWVERFDTRT